MSKRHIKIVEVGPRDGLQNEPNHVSTVVKAEFVNQLSKTGLSHIEVSSFVNPKKIPQLADAKLLFDSIHREKQVAYSALVPNKKGLYAALESRVDSIAVFTAASNTFCEKNINCTIEESIDRFIPVIALAKTKSIPVRAYVSCVLGCPYEGYIQPEKVSEVAARLWELGCYEISLGDTIGAGTPNQARRMIEDSSRVVPMEKLAVHFHDTRGQALANIFAAIEMGISTIDSSVAGLGGCPYANGATGNVATEDVVYLLQGMGFETGIDLEKLINAGKYICAEIDRKNQSKIGFAGLPMGYDVYEKS